MPRTISRPSLREFLLATALFSSASGCASEADGECSQGGECTSVTIVEYGTTLSGPYTLVLDIGSTSAVARCNAPLDMATEDNPEWLSCDATSVTVTGDQATAHSSVRLTIQVDADEDPYVVSELVDLNVDETEEPNGPDCEPACYERSGQLLVQG
jgi:hypothetical protein